MTKQEILDHFKDIDFMYNDPTKSDTLSLMIDKLLREHEGEQTATWTDDCCSNCKRDMPAFISGSRWEQYPTEYCPTCGARMTNGKE